MPMEFNVLTDLVNNITDVDSYKPSQWLQYPPKTSYMSSYLSSRGGMFGKTVHFGLQYLMMEYLTRPVTMEHVKKAAEFFPKHGEPFNVEGWTKIVERNGGKLPVRIRSAPEGAVIPVHNALLDVQSLDPENFWVVSWLEDQFVRMWYPTTVATLSWYAKKLILEYLEETADDPHNEILFKLHDFGGRGVTCREQAGIGGMSHVVNFMGSDTCPGVLFANYFYDCEMSAYSIPASEHSTITMWGRERELLAMRNMVKQFGKPGKILACVSDSYNIWNAIENYWCGELLPEIKESGATVVIRPDSGNPPEVVLKCLKTLERKVGMQRNKKGYKVLPSYFRLIQGDGCDLETIGEILQVMKAHEYSATNIAFGMGGALLQKVNRDTQKFAFKCSEGVVDGETVKVFKDPIDDPGKRSRAGKVALIRTASGFETIEGPHAGDVLETVFENGEIMKKFTLEQVRKNSAEGL